MQDNLALCLDDCLKATEIDPKFTRAYLRAAQVYIKMGDLLNSKKQINLMLQHDPKNEKALNEKGKIETLAKNMESAKEMLQKQQFDKAAKLFGDLLGEMSDSDTVKLLFSEALMGKNRFGEADSILMYHLYFMLNKPTKPIYLQKTTSEEKSEQQSCPFPERPLACSIQKSRKRRKVFKVGNADGS